MLVVVFLSEIPTGVIGDSVGRARSMSICFATMVLGSVIYFVSRSLLIFAIGEAVLAIGISFYSGSAQAWLVDSLHNIGYDKDLTSVFSKVNTYRITGAIIGGLIGSIIASYSLQLSWAAAACIFVSCFIYSVLMLHDGIGLTEHENAVPKRSSKQTVRYAFKYIKSNKAFKYFLLASIVFSFFSMPLNMFWQPFFNDIFNSILMMGVINALIHVSLVSGNLIGGKYTLSGAKKVIYLGVLVTALSLVAIYFTRSALVILILFLIHEIGRGILSPIQSTIANRTIPSRERATLLSINSMVGLFGYVTAVICLSGIAKVSIQRTWLIAGLSLLFVLPIYNAVLKFIYHGGENLKDV